ncbi:MAG: single-stranded-DNA-specific exonuclease RecJ [Desulfobacula sp.]|nr:single-stranded-DNA-specific exonuclease RecJ [Desulfobacula sp.]
MDTLIKYFKPDPQIVARLTDGLNCHPILAALLAQRKITTVEKAKLFLKPTFEHLKDPFLLKDMTLAVERIYTAMANQEKILIFGDFDADGVTATALLVDFFQYCDAPVSWYIPHRLKEGYSLQADHIQMAVDQDIDLIITVDCGVSSHEAVSLAELQDIDVIITDHHEPEASLPEAVAIIDPKRKDCPSGLDLLAGVGVAFYLIIALRQHFRKLDFWEDIQEPNLSDYLDLLAIGTIGDMVPLVDENRLLCIAGLEKIRQGKRLGIKTLIQSSRIDIQKLDSDDISFKIVPRINAAGRISHARICVTQLTSPDIIAAEKTASLLDQLNQKRQKIEREIVADIENKLLKSPQLLKQRLLFLWDKNWNPSVLGIAASKLSRKYCCPVILMSTAGDQAVGSCRSINNINIHQALKAHETFLVKFGGHAMACGLTVDKDNLSALAVSMKHYMLETISKENFQKSVTIDSILDFADINYPLACEINQLRPFGVANPEPVFLCKDVSVISSYIIGGSHRKMILGKQGSSSTDFVEAFHFNINDPENLPDYFSRIAFKLKINKFKSNAAQMIIEDIGSTQK